MLSVGLAVVAGGWRTGTVGSWLKEQSAKWTWANWRRSRVTSSDAAGSARYGQVCDGNLLRLLLLSWIIHFGEVPTFPRDAAISQSWCDDSQIALHCALARSRYHRIKMPCRGPAVDLGRDRSYGASMTMSL